MGLKPKYKVGDRVILRCHNKRFRLTIEEVRANHGGQGWHRYWGVCPGSGLGEVGAYEDELEDES